MTILSYFFVTHHKEGVFSDLVDFSFFFYVCVMRVSTIYHIFSLLFYSNFYRNFIFVGIYFEIDAICFARLNWFVSYNVCERWESDCWFFNLSSDLIWFPLRWFFFFLNPYGFLVVVLCVGSDYLLWTNNWNAEADSEENGWQQHFGVVLLMWLGK